MALNHGGNGVLRIISSDGLAAIDRAEEERREAEEEQLAPALQGLAHYVMECWTGARDNKDRAITDRLLEAQNARLGRYDSDKLRKIRGVGGSEEYARVTANKCRVAEAWLRDVYLGQSEKPWTIKATPYPDMPPTEKDRIREVVSAEIAEAQATLQQPVPDSVVQSRMNELEDAVSERMRDEARSAIERMERKMHDQMLEGGWAREWGRFLNDLVTYPAAHFKGPILRSRSSIAWKQQGEDWEPVPEEGVALEWERVDPFRIYPSANSTDPQDGYIIEHVTFSREDLHALIGVDGFDEGAIRGALEEYGRGGLVNWLGFSGVERQEQQQDSQDRDKGPLIDIDGLEYHGPVSGEKLLEWGLSKEEIKDPDADYEACVWLVGRWVIKAQLNYDPTRTRPYFKASWEELPGSYWGLGLVDTLKDVQGIVNAAVRSLVNNMAMASGPQVSVNVDRLPPGEEITTLTPWKIWQVQDSAYGSTGDAIDFFQPDANVNEILTVVEKFYQFADDWSLIPRYMSGNDRVGGAGRTASGLSMLLNAANKGLKGIVSTIDTEVLSPMLEKLYTYNMLFDEDSSLKGDAEVVARGAVSLMQLETLQLRRNEFLTATNNDADMGIIGPEGRAEVLREVAKGLEMDVNRVVPMRGKVGQAGQAAAAQEQGAAGGGVPPTGEQLMNGAAVTDNFSPNTMRPTG